MDFLKLFSNVPEALVVVSPELKILAATDAYLRLTMRSREDIIGKHFLLEAFPDPDVPYENNPVRQSLEKALQTKQPDYLDVIPYGIAIPETEGGGFYEGYWEASHTPVLDAAGNVEYLIQRTADVTEREKARLAAAATENKFRFMAETLPQLIFTLNPAGDLTYMNQRWVRYTGLPLESLMQQGWQEAVHPEDLPHVMRRWEEAMKNREAVQFEVRQRDQAGAYRWHLCKTQPMTDADGNIIMWAGACTDIHETRQMVQELHATNEQMASLSDQVQVAYAKAEAERRILERLIMKAPAFFCILEGPEHRFELVNDKYQQLFPKRRLLHRTVAEAIPEVVSQGFVEILDRVYQTGEEYLAEETLVKLDQHHTGIPEDLYLTFIYQPLYDEHHRITGILVFGYEVNDRVRYRQKLQALGVAEEE